VSEIWKVYRSARMLFSKNAPAEHRVETVCDSAPSSGRTGRTSAACAQRTTFFSRSESEARIVWQLSARSSTTGASAVVVPLSVVGWQALDDFFDAVELANTAACLPRSVRR
jgi:hypothetical protein